MRSMAPVGVNLMSLRVRSRCGSKDVAVGAVRLDLWRKEKKATRNKAHKAAWKGRATWREPRIWCSRSMVMGCFWRGRAPMRRLSPFLVRAMEKLSAALHGKP